MTRLSVVDEIFLRTHRGMGVPIAMQGVWITAEPITPDALDAIDEALSRGSLGLRIVTPRVPGARRRWVSSTGRTGARWTEGTTADRAVRWADRQADVLLDPEYGPGWSLSAAPLDTGGTVVSLVCSHVVADARGLIRAAEAALSGRDAPRSRLADFDTSDASDAASTLSTVIGRSAVAAAALAVRPTRRTELRRYLSSSRGEPRASPAAPPPGWAPASVTVDVDAARWEATAAADDGTPNVLFLSVVAAAVDELRGGGGDSVLLGVPMKVEDQGGANGLSITAVRVERGQRLGDIRGRAKSAYRSPLRGPAGFPDELLHVVPQRWASVLAPSTGRRDALCSNIGDLPDGIRTIGGRPAIRIAARAIHPVTDPESVAASPCMLSAYLCRTADVYTMSIVVTDPSVDGDAMRIATATSLDRHGLDPSFW